MITRTQKQIEASRLNGAKSRGPVTAAGKAISAQNARRHHVLSEAVVLASENSDDFRKMTQEYYQELEPATAFERTLVDTIATARWRQRRASALERAAFDVEAPRARLRVLSAVAIYESRLQRQILSAHKCLLDLQDRCRRGVPPEPPTPNPTVIPIDAPSRRAA